MADLCNLIRWIIIYAVTGGFWHFIAVYMILVVLVRTLRIVSVDITRRVSTAEKPEPEVKP